MESSRGRALNPQEKAQLKEKLALLKREYRRTFHRLQNAERAERVKTYVKRTVAEQNLLLVQEENEKHRAGSSIRQVALTASGGVSAGTCPAVSPSKTASVTFKPDPEVFRREDSCLPSTPVSRQDCRKVLFGPLGPAPEKSQAHLSRSRTRAQRRATFPLEKREETACEAVWRDAGRQPEQRAAGRIGGSQSPVFKRRSRSTWEAVPKLSAATTDGSSCESTPSVLRPGYVQESPRETPFPGDSHPSPLLLSCESRVPSLNSSCQEGFCFSSKDSAGECALSQEDLKNVRKGAAQTEGDQALSGEEDPGLGTFAESVESSQDFEGHGTIPGVPGDSTLEEGRPGKEPWASGVCQGDPPIKSRAKGLGELLEPDLPLQEQQIPSAVPTQKVLSSCTMVEGLLFPVEYYVRTTRRMSGRQREVNVEAIIQSQLGRSKKRPKVTQKERNTDPVLFSQEAAESAGLPKILPSLSPAASPFLQPSCESAASNGGLAQCEGPWQPRRKRRRPRGRARCQASSSSLQDPLENSEIADGLLISSETQGKDNEPGGRGSLCEGPFGPGVASWARPVGNQSGGAPRLHWLPPPSLDPQEFCLPEDEFGLLKSEKLKACAVKAPGSLAAEGLLCPGEVGCEGSALGSAREASPVSSSPPGLHQRGLSSSELLLSPALGGASCPVLSPLPTPAFPMVGTTPASPALQASPVFPEVFCASPWQAKAGAAGEPGTLAEASPSFPRSGTKRQQSQSQRRARWQAEEDVASLEEGQFLAGEAVEGPSESPKEVECPVEASLEGMLGEGNLQMTSKLKSCSGSSSVDVGAVWWEAADFTALCVVTASETSVSLWRHLDAGHWAVVHTWHFTKVPVIQIVPLPGVRNLVCVALGCLEIAEIWFLFHSSEEDSVKQSLVKAGNIKAILGLKKGRLVTSSGSLGDQEVEVVSFSEQGRSNERRALRPPEEAILAFAEVDGMQEALVGMTTTNCLVVWNLTSGQLLRKMSVGRSYPASVCHKAYADAGLLFVVLSHPHAKESKARGIPAFQVVAFNPKTARSATMTLLSVPPGTGGRYLEGEVRDASAAAVLTSGAIAVWDLFLGRCTAILPASPEGNWSLVRWSVTDLCLLAGRNDGSVYIYSYTSHPRSA